jgi:hypothetical protein
VTLGLFDTAFVGGLVGPAYDVSAQAYITAVETADGQVLETGMRDAINAFVVGCKADGIWDAIRASCILAGARTLNGALTPLVGTAPTNFNFVSGDYNRKTGLRANTSAKYLDSNRANNADPQNSKHLATFRTQWSADHTAIGSHIASGASSCGLYWGGGGFTFFPAINIRVNGSSPSSISASATGFSGGSRANSSSYTVRGGSTTYAVTGTSDGNSSANVHVFKASNQASAAGAPRLSFYSIGESLDLALLDARVTTLMNALAVAIP